MPPLQGGLKVRGHSRDIVSQVEDKLKLKTALPLEILKATRSSLRVLKIRNPIGCFGKYDNDMKRACALLEYDVRDYNMKIDINTSIEVDMERLAKAAFMNSKAFRDFHEKIGNFRENLRINAPSKLKMKKKLHNDTCKSRSAATVTSNSSIIFRKSSISSLAIQLGAFVPNSFDVALRAQKLFHKVVDIMKDSSKFRGIYALQDLQSNQSSYEAACFYLITTSGLSNNVSIRRRRRSSKGYDGNDNQQLNLTTLMDVANVSSQFKMILDYVSELKNEIESKRSTNNDATSESSRSRPSSASSCSSPVSKTRSKEGAFSGGRDNDQNREDRESEHAACIDLDNFLNNDHAYDKKESNGHQRSRKRKSHSMTIFEEWKANVLRVAREDSRQKMSGIKEKNNEVCEEKQRFFEEECILDFVTKDILSQNDLL